MGYGKCCGVGLLNSYKPTEYDHLPLAPALQGFDLYIHTHTSICTVAVFAVVDNDIKGDVLVFLDGVILVPMRGIPE